MFLKKWSRKTLEKALSIYKEKEDGLRLYLKREHLFRYDINKSKEVKAMFIIRLLSLYFLYIFFILANRALAAVFFLMTAEAPIL